ncbi:MAG: helix-turn-helix domain-containing protein [Lachnospiraceae bacterium]|nr:helix-turn-helix domain-containing protein [Lachnospiraceae bacterium]
MELGYNIQLFRMEKHLSQEELAEKCNVSRQAVTKWEQEESTPTLEKLMLLADIFDVSLDELVGRVKNDASARLIRLVKQMVVDDIPVDEDDEISAIVSRYLLFIKSINLDAVDAMRGLQDIFLKKDLFNEELKTEPIE